MKFHFTKQNSIRGINPLDIKSVTMAKQVAIHQLKDIE